MVRRYLPLNPLRAFEAAARHLSFTRAAIELNVTHAAVSQQVRALEEQLGCVLFTRVSRGLVLTHEGEGLLPVLNEAFDGTVAKLAMRQPFVLFKGLTFQKLCLPGAFRP
ncbi:LysR family transcriptional regulator, partial [Escherichia coli]